MINCPKCNFLQPKDQYCARCGVNMETYKPPKVPGWKKFVGNWMVQLSALFILIFLVVLRDNFSTQNSESVDNSLPPVSNQISRDETASFASNRVNESSNDSVDAEPEIVEVSSDGGDEFRDQSPTEPSRLNKKITMRVFTINRSAIERILPSARRIDDGVFVVTSKFAADFRRSNSSEVKSFGTSRKDFKFAQPTEVFLGEQDLETGINFGFFTQVMVADNSNKDSIKAEVRFWNQLKLTDDPSPPLSFEVSMRSQDSLLVIDPSVHDVEFSSDEINLFESSNKLRELASEVFLESQSDIALFLQIK